MLAGARNLLRSLWSLPRRGAGALLWLSLALFGATPTWAAFSLTFQGLVQTIPAGGAIALSSPGAVAVAPDGTVYLADTGNNRIVAVNPQGLASALAITGLSPALSGPGALALDGAGILYIADTGNARVVKVAADGAGSVVSTGSVVLGSPMGVAVDPSGDLFIADAGSSQIVEVTAGGSAAALTINVSGGPALSSPRGLAVDRAGALFIADHANNRIVKVAAGSTVGVVQAIGGGVTLSGPSAVAVDVAGNLYIADTGNDRIAEVDTAGNGSVLYPATLSGPTGVAVDVLGNIFVADTGNGQGLFVAPLLSGDPGAGLGYTTSLNKTAVNFGHVQLGSATGARLVLPFTTGFNAAPASFQVLTNGSPSLDFTVVAGAGTTLSGATGTSASATVEVQFLPTAPGLRRGSVVLYDASDRPMLIVPLAGFADAPVAALAPNRGTVVNAGALALANPYQVALDGAGNMLVGVYSGKNVTRIAAGGGSAERVTLGNPGGPAIQNITGVAIDGAGNLFIGDHQNSRILVATPAGDVSVLSITGLGSALGFPTALHLDAAGNLLIADFTNGRILSVSCLKVTGSAAAGVGTVLSTGSYSFAGSTVTGLCGDPFGNVYVAARTQNNSRIIKVTAAGAGSVLPITGLGVAVSNPQGVASDAFGNIYVVDTANSRIVRVTTAGVCTALGISVQATPATLGSFLFGVTADPAGNLYISDWTNGRIVFANVGGAALDFPTTATGATSSPLTATVANLGNQPLVFSADPAYTADFSQYGSDPNPVTSSTSLWPGTLADVPLQFTPQSAGTLSAGITVTDNTLNVAGSTQQVSVSGTSFSPGDTTTTSVSISPSPLYAGMGGTLTATVTDSTSGHTAIVPTGSVTFIDTVGSTITTLGSATLSAGHASLTGIQLSGLGSHTITATYAGVSGTFLTSSGSATVVLNPSLPATVALSSSTNGTGYVGQAITFTAMVSNTLGTTPSGTVDFLDGATVLGSAVLADGSATFTLATLALGAHSITASYGGDGADAAAVSSALDQPIASPAVVASAPATPVVAGTDGVATAELTLNSLGTLGSPITFTVTGLPAGTTCSFDQPNPIVGASPVVVNVTLATTPRLRIIGQNHGSDPLAGWGAGALLGAGVLGLPLVRRKRRFGIFLSALALVLAGGMTACTSSNSGKGITTGTSGTPAGTYTISITASSQGATGATSTIQLVVN